MNWWEEDSFVHFLYWLVSDKDYTANAIINVVEKPYHYKELWDEFKLKENDDN